MVRTFAVSPLVEVAGQLYPECVSALAGAGFSRVICNRPDDEEPGQPSMAEVEAACKEVDIEFVEYPVTALDFPGLDLPRFSDNLQVSSGKVLAYCRSGVRSANLWLATLSAEDYLNALEVFRSTNIDLTLATRYRG